MHLNHQFIGGEWRPGRGSKTLVDLNPYDGSVIAEVTIANLDDIDDAYRAAERAMQVWGQVNPIRKRAVFEAAIRWVEDHTAEIVHLIVRELGGTLLKANFEIGLALDVLKEAATFPMRMEGRIMPSPVDGKENFVYRRPAGVVGVISPFNFPFLLGLKAVAAAIATGNGVVLKPHEETPVVGGALIAEMFEAAGIPPGLLNVVITEIPAIGDAFVEHPVPRIIAFTGSAKVGAHVAGVAARNLKKPLLELGGNSALIVLDDADLSLAVDAAIFSRCTHAGQVCMSANRVLVHTSVYDQVVSRYVEKAESLTVGDPSDPNTIIGPLINVKQAETLNALVDRSIAQGARAILRRPVRGALFAPAVLVDVQPHMEAFREELFGPVVCIVPFTDDDHAVTLANDTRYGLSGAIHTRDPHRAVALAKRINTGMIHINDTTIADEAIVPFGGEGASGMGRLNGACSLHEFSTTQWISIHHGRPVFPY